MIFFGRMIGDIRMKKEYLNDKLKDIPDISKCRAKDIGMYHFAKCLVNNPIDCVYAFPFGNGFFCQHPKREEIIKNSKNVFDCG